MYHNNRNLCKEVKSVFCNWNEECNFKYLIFGRNRLLKFKHIYMGEKQNRHTGVFVCVLGGGGGGESNSYATI